MSTETPILEIRNLKVSRGGVSVLDVPSLSLLAGEALCLIGPNGAGKSTLLLSLARLLKPQSGELIFRGQPVASNSSDLSYRRNLAMVFQEPLLLDTTVYDNVASGLKIRGMGKKDIGKIVTEYTGRFGIDHLLHRSARKLSGGEAQRTSLARAFATGPAVILLDEPFSSLDPPTRESLLGDLEGTLRETNTTAIMTTHDQREALRLSDRIAFMSQGRILQIGTPETVMNSPVDELVASFVGVETVLKGEVVRTGAGIVVCRVGDGEIEAVGSLKIGDKVTCCIRPEQVTLSLESPGDKISARNTFSGRITKITPLGMFYKVNLDCGFPLTAYVTIPAAEALSLRMDKPVFASFKATAVHLIHRVVGSNYTNSVSPESP